MIRMMATSTSVCVYKEHHERRLSASRVYAKLRFRMLKPGQNPKVEDFSALWGLLLKEALPVSQLWSSELCPRMSRKL